MQANFAAQLKHALSNERLSSYQKQVNDSSKLKLYCHYAWNMALSESLYSTLQTLEVTLRNSIHNTLRQHFGYDDWYNNSSIISFSGEIKTLDKARLTLQRKHKPLEPSRIIAELNFGFWANLLDRRYEQVLWPHLLKPTFPHAPRRFRTRQVLSKQFNKARILRNRIFHHEPVWSWCDLSLQHQNILEAISWIEPAMKDLVMAIDRFPDIHKNGLCAIERKLQQFC